MLYPRPQERRDAGKVLGDGLLAACLEIEPQQWLGITRPHVAPPIAVINCHAV
jgi:hypothetical protein